jgi:hypothetical protein
MRQFPENGEDWTDEQFDDYQRGRVVIGISETLCALCECCPEQGSDQYKINAWHELLDSAVWDVAAAAAFADWGEGANMAKALDVHTSNEAEEDGALSSQWLRDLAFHCFPLRQAAKAYWPSPVWPDEEEDE